ncbi:uncharacterized protein TNCV_3330941 [Trichonephila clavipes]|nr:uncharacterized protein TNCV_3330941 [Trichonephila clavipes]
MQYLLQSVEPHSKAERLVLSFPATATNYSKAIEQLKERFGRDDLLVQIYVRHLLELVMKNAVKGRSKTDLTYLYDELEGKLRALESLGRAQEKTFDEFSSQRGARRGDGATHPNWSFGPQHNFRKNNASGECVIQSELATTSALVILDSGKRSLCIFCDKGTALVSPTHPTWRNSIGAPKTPIHSKDRVYKQG